MKTRYRTDEELEKVRKYLNDHANIEGNKYVSLLVANWSGDLSLTELLNRYFKERRWMKKDECYAAFKGEFFKQKYF